MYLGSMVEIGDEDQIYSPPTHPHTQALLAVRQEKSTTDVPLLEPRPDGVSAHDSACHFAEPLALVWTPGPSA